MNEGKECIYGGICHDLETVDGVRMCTAEDEECTFLVDIQEEEEI